MHIKSPPGFCGVVLTFTVDVCLISLSLDRTSAHVCFFNQKFSLRWLYFLRPVLSKVSITAEIKDIKRNSKAFRVHKITLYSVQKARLLY